MKSIIKKSVNSRRIKIILLALTLIGLLSMYFVIAYLISLYTLNTASDVIANLEIVFQKGSCMDYSISFVRANQIRNETMMIQSASELGFGQKLAE